MSVQSSRPDVDAAAAAIKGIWFPVKGTVHSLPEVLAPDEMVQVLAVAHHDRAMGVLVLTDRRFLFRAQNWSGQRMVTHSFPEITDIRWSGGLEQGVLTVFIGGWAAEFKNMDKRDGQHLAECMRQWRQWYAAQGGAGAPQYGQPVQTAPIPPQYGQHTQAAPVPQQYAQPAPAAPVHPQYAQPAPVPPQYAAPHHAQPASPAPVPPQSPRPPASSGGGLFGRRRREAEAEAARLGDELRAHAADTETLRAENARLQAQLSALVGADAARLAQEAERIGRTHAERLGELERIDAVLDAKVEAAAVRAEGELHGTRQRLTEMEAQAQEAERRLAAARGALVVTDDLALLQEAGIYEYRHPLADAVAYKAELDRIKEQYKALTKNGRAVVGVTEWTVNGSAAEGRRMVRDFSKLMLRAYNAEADAAVRGMKPHRLASLVDRLVKSRETIAKLGKTMQIQVTDQYHRLRVKELELTADHLAKQEAEKERRREERERQREEERLEREIARERARLDKERNRLVLALNRARTAGQADATQIAELERKLTDLDAEEEAIDRREANRRAGYVYVISNIGAFGESMVKIGLTRRLDPMDRVIELGDASVPFRFDVHALIYSDDAVGLERALHQEFEPQRVNRVNARREFFHVTPGQVRDALTRHAGQHLLEFHEQPDAPEWRASVAAGRE
ncbi:DUF4041 domain-containing protein [Streptomyces seoulensis]|uniref:DUF4041 domain-containing protein n=1 Tax=Streptomyces seoulensis TaxID=73044 RepID=A0A4P6U221_STRSO|nr:DUF4041 domain-containing protein [Streptomyces seoulensis]QBJ93091.1 DUF4041 domain-containing protein [Streptomyces seoulensis]